MVYDLNFSEIIFHCAMINGCVLKWAKIERGGTEHGGPGERSRNGNEENGGEGKEERKVDGIGY